MRRGDVSVCHDGRSFRDDYRRLLSPVARHKLGLGFISGDQTEVTNIRCVVVRISSNTGEAKINAESL
jgi:hypothetical protein